MWFELVLNGVGGKTIAEAKECISYNEFCQWVQYRNKRGSLNLGMRIERSSALLAALYTNAHSKNGGNKIVDFMPHADEEVILLDQAMKEWK